MASLTPAELQAELANTYGDILMGTMCGLILFGITLHQLYYYCRTCGGDSTWKKVYIGYIVVIDTFHAVICMHISYFSLVTHYLDPDTDFNHAPWSLSLLTLETVITVISCQSFLAYRVWRVGGRRFIPIVILSVLMMLAQVGVALAETVTSFITPNFAQFAQWSWTVSWAYGLAAGVDLLLSVTLMIFLRRNRSVFSSTNSKLDLLTVYTMSTGTLTTTFGIIAFILSVTDPSKLTFAGVSLVGTKIYANTVLAAVNLRNAREFNSTAPKDVSVELSGYTSSSTGRRAPPIPTIVETAPRSSASMVDIKVNQEELVTERAEV